MKIRALITVEWAVEDLSDYGVKTLEEAVAITRKQVNQKEMSIEDILFIADEGVDIKLIAVKD